MLRRRNGPLDRPSRRARRGARPLDRLLGELDDGRLGGGRARRRAGDRQDASAGRAVASRADARGHLVLAGIGVGARARPAVLGLRGCARRVRARARRRPLSTPLDEDVRGGARARLPVALSAGDGAERARSSTSATAATARCARCSSSSRRHSRSCSCSTTCTGPTPARSSCSARCSAGRRPRRS